MNMIESALDGEGYEQRYAVYLARYPLNLIRRPVSIAPAEGTVALCDNGTRDAVGPRRTPGTFRNGRWVGPKFEPTHWNELAGKDD
jgi:hypothetical protein